jgi:Fe-S-cluster-containing hydrogenase component 2
MATTPEQCMYLSCKNTPSDLEKSNEYCEHHYTRIDDQQTVAKKLQEEVNSSNKKSGIQTDGKSSLTFTPNYDWSLNKECLKTLCETPCKGVCPAWAFIHKLNLLNRE